MHGHAVTTTIHTLNFLKLRAKTRSVLPRCLKIEQCSGLVICWAIGESVHIVMHKICGLLQSYIFWL